MENLRKNFFRTSIVTVFVLTLLMGIFTTSQASGTPLIFIQTVAKDVSVIISGTNFPADQTFTVRMGAFGTMGIGGTIVGTKDPASGSAFTATYTIPAALVGASKIAIRLESPQGYFSYNWFYNAPPPAATPAAPASTPIPGFSGIPTFSISAVNKNVSVTVLTSNFPASQDFTVRMGEFGTMGIGGTIVATTASGSGGSMSATYTIPASLVDRSRIAIRIDFPSGHYSYNWFYNNTTGAAAPVVPPESPAVPGYTEFPTFMILSVVKDGTVKIQAYNFPPGQSFKLRMGEFGTLGIGGIVVTTVNTGAGGNFIAQYDIPAALAGRDRIAIRLDSDSGYYYAYNWFYNN
jgi:hypothetical protein